MYDEYDKPLDDNLSVDINANALDSNSGSNNQVPIVENSNSPPTMLPISKIILFFSNCHTFVDVLLYNMRTFVNYSNINEEVSASEDDAYAEDSSSALNYEVSIAEGSANSQEMIASMPIRDISPANAVSNSEIIFSFLLIINELKTSFIYYSNNL